MDEIANSNMERPDSAPKTGAARSTNIQVDISAETVRDGGRVAGVNVEGSIMGPVTIHVSGPADDLTRFGAVDLLSDLPLPPLDLPDKPYRYLDWYRSEDAGIFFGRGREIRQLYDRMTAPDGAPIVLLYGQSGVGKSSLLAAGLLPRLDANHAVRYARRLPPSIRHHDCFDRHRADPA